MATREVYRIEIPIETTDRYSEGLRRARRDVSRFEAESSRMQRRMERMRRQRWELTIRAVDRASRVASSISSYINRVASRSYRFTIRAHDMATRTIRGVGNMITSLPGVITIGLSVIGVGKLKDATVGAAMNFEQYEVSMTHWLDGNTKKAKELVTWMGQFADTTPFSSPDLFPALATGVGIAGGDVSEAQRMLKIAADMAALTPGRTVSDAMDALGSAQMGNFEMMKGFGLRILKDDYDAMGGWAGFLNEVESKFLDGAQKLSVTSAGILATLRGYRSSIFRSLGEGFLDPMKPRLDSINEWLANNQETWGRWKNTVKQAGEDASEWLFSRLESGFSYIRTNYLENDDFKKLDFEGKIGFIMDDINKWWTSRGKPALSNWWESTGKPWAVETGTFIGEAIFSGIVAGLKGGLSSLKDIWKNAFKDPGVSSIGGALTATALAGAAGSMVLSPILRAGSAVGRGARWGWNRTFGRERDGNGTQRRSRGSLFSFARRRRPRVPSAAERTRRAREEMEAARRYSQSPQAYRPPRNTRNLGLTSMGGLSRGLSRIPFLRTGLSLLSLGTASEEEMPGIIGSILGGLGGAKGGAMAGAAIGSVIPGVGTAVGGAVGGILGGIGGSLGGEWLGNQWDTIKEKASDAASWVSTKFSETKETLSSTLFSGEWWGSKWEEVKQTATSTVFNGGWWAEQVGFVYGYLESTLFSGDWWSGKWEEVKAWTSEKWESANEIWDNTVSNIGETLFNGEWWVGHWDSVKGWASDTVDSFSNVWSSAKSLAESTLFSADWWSGKWGQVKSWASSAWENIKSGFSLGREQGQSGANAKKYARGGLITSPHLGLVGEAGPEMIIPLSSGRRSRALELYRRTGQMLGVRQFADGGLVGAGVSVPTGQRGGGGITFGDINIYPVVSVELSGDGDMSAISDAIVDELGVKLADKTMEALKNMFINAE